MCLCVCFRAETDTASIHITRNAGVFSEQLTAHETFLTVDGLRRWSNLKSTAVACIGILWEIDSKSNQDLRIAPRRPRGALFLNYAT
jgi:hypothetical protein